MSSSAKTKKSQQHQQQRKWKKFACFGFLLAFLALIAIVGPLGVISPLVRLSHGTDDNSHNISDFYQLSANLIAGDERGSMKDPSSSPVFSFSGLKGSPVLVVNVASECGLTRANYDELNEILSRFPDLKILGFPCNQFLGQEPGSNSEIVSKITERFHVLEHKNFYLFEKVDVNGPNTHNVYKFLKSKSGKENGAAIEWNFAKFLVDRSGNVVGRFHPQVSPLRMIADIEQVM